MNRSRRGGFGGWAAAGAGLLLAVGALGGCDLLKPKAQKAFGEACALDTECTSGDCVPFGNVCSKACTYNKDCGEGFVCRSRDDGTAGDHCAKPQGNPPNGACKSPSECENGQCLTKTDAPNDPGICSRYCQTGDDCPAGMKICQTISNTGDLKVCLPGDPAAAAAQASKFGAAPKTTKPKPVPTTTTPTATTVVTPPAPLGSGPNVGSRTPASATPSATPTAAPTAAPATTPSTKPTGIKIGPRH